MGIAPVYQRLAELYCKFKKAGLSDDEAKELNQCLEVNMQICWNRARLENFSLMASMSEDVEWQHEVCRQIDDLETEKKPGRTGTDQK